MQRQYVFILVVFLLIVIGITAFRYSPWYNRNQQYSSSASEEFMKKFAAASKVKPTPAPLTTEYTGTIQKITKDTKGTTIVLSTDQKAVVTYTVPTSDLSKVVIQSPSSSTPLQLSDLKVGQKIQIKDTVDASQGGHLQIEISLVGATSSAKTAPVAK